MRSLGYEFVRIEGKRHLVCAKCRYPLLKGHDPPYFLPEPTMPVLNEKMKQAVCGPCYQEMYAEMYPDSEIGDVFNGRAPDLLPIPWEKAQALVIEEKEPDDYGKWELALQAARSSGGAERVEDAFHRLFTAPKPDVTMTGITENIEEAEPQAV